MIPSNAGNDPTTNPMNEDKQQTILKPPLLDKAQVEKWLNRAKTANKIHRKEFWPKYRQAKKRYRSEMGYASVGANINSSRPRHNDINYLKKTVQDFIASIFYRNPEVDLQARNPEDEQEVRNIENLEQLLNDDIHDRESELKSKIRVCLVDEYLASLGILYLDYEYKDRETGNPILDETGNPMMDEGNPLMEREQLSQKVIFERIRPENLIRPPWINFYNYKESPYLGYVDIVTLEELKEDKSLDSSVVSRIQGKDYRSLIDIEVRDQDLKKEIENADDLLHAKIYCIFIKSKDGSPLKRLVMTDDENVRGEALAYSDYDKGHGFDNRGYPIYLLELNESCEGLIPPSEAWISEPLLNLMDYVYEKMVKHIRRSSTRTFFKEGTGGFNKEALEKAIRNNDQEYIGIPNLPVGTPVQSILQQLADIPLSEDHTTFFQLTKMIYEQLSRQPSFSKPSIINRKKTATETEAIQQSDSTENGDLIDKFKDFLKDIFYDWAKLKQRNLQGTVSVSVLNSLTGQKEERADLTRDHFQGEFHADVDVTSFLPPNKALKRQQVKEIIQDAIVYMNPLLKGIGETLNAKKLTDMYMENADIRNTEDLFIPIPLREIDQQVSDLVFNGVPFNPDHLGQDTEKSANRLQQIFMNEPQMTDYTQKRPGIHNDILNFMNYLIQTSQAKKMPSSSKGISSDISRNASLLGNAQNV